MTGFELILSWPNVWARAFGSGRVPNPAIRRSRSSRIQKENKKFKKCVRSIFHFNIVTPTFYGTFFSCPGKRYLISKKQNCKTEQNVRLCLSNFFFLLLFSFFLLFTFSKKSLLDGASKKYLMWKSLLRQNRMILERSEQSEVKVEWGKNDVILTWCCFHSWRKKVTMTWHRGRVRTYNPAVPGSIITSDC